PFCFSFCFGLGGGAPGATSAAFGSWPWGVASGSACPAWFASFSLVSVMGLFRFHARNRLAGRDRDPLHCTILVHAPSDPCGLPRLGVEQHDLRRRDRRRQLDDGALLIGVGGAFVLL